MNPKICFHYLQRFKLLKFLLHRDKFEDKKHKLKTPNRKQSSNANDFQSLNKTTGTTGLGLSEIETTPAPPDFDEPESTHKPRRLSTHTASQKSKRESVIHYEKVQNLLHFRENDSMIYSERILLLFFKECRATQKPAQKFCRRIDQVLTGKSQLRLRFGALQVRRSSA